jgi:hypothetical protein
MASYSDYLKDAKELAWPEEEKCRDITTITVDELRRLKREAPWEYEQIKRMRKEWNKKCWADSKSLVLKEILRIKRFRRVNAGICVWFGCDNFAEDGVQKCAYHSEVVRKYKVEKRKAEKEKLRVK